MKLYGMTAKGGKNDHGTIFQIDPVTHELSVLFSFHRKIGTEPHGSLIAGPTYVLYGMTRESGDKDLGVVFSFDLTKNALKVLHHFQGGPNDGATPYHGNLAFGKDFTTLYGLTYNGGYSPRTTQSDGKGLGVIFSVSREGDTQSGGLKILHQHGRTFGRPISSWNADV